MESTIVYWGNIRVILGLYADNGKENGSYYSLIGSIIPPPFPSQSHVVSSGILGGSS